jgi:hypothetical protein
MEYYFFIELTFSTNDLVPECDVKLVDYFTDDPDEIHSNNINDSAAKSDPFSPFPQNEFNPSTIIGSVSKECRDEIGEGRPIFCRKLFLF